MTGDSKSFTLRDLGVVVALVVSVGGGVVAISSKSGSQDTQIQYHERRITALEAWQGEARSTLHDMDKKLDRLIQMQGYKP